MAERNKMPNRWCSIEFEFNREHLLAVFEDNRHSAKVYVDEKYKEKQPISLLNVKDSYIDDLLDKFNYVRDGYFLSSGGYEPHIDNRRTCVLTFTLKNNYNVPLSFYGDKELANIVESVDMTHPFLWDTTLLHGSEESPEERIFYQIEFEDDQPYEFYYNEFISGRLIK